MKIKHTSPWFLGIIVAREIFSSIRARTPVLSSDELINVPELLPSRRSNQIEVIKLYRNHLYTHRNIDAKEKNGRIEQG